MGDFQAINCQNCGQQVMDLNFFSNTKTICTSCANNSAKRTKTKNNFDKKQKLEENRVHIDNSLVTNKLKKLITSSLKKTYNKSHSQIIILCIGTDRSTGDALGPLTGSRLSKIFSPQTPVFGTLDNPVHATNLKKHIKHIKQEYFNPFILAVDAGLGKNSSVGSIKVSPGPLKPGSGVDKDLPSIGDMHITGLVNIGGYMEYFVLQSTRLSLVIKMSKIISRGINWGLRKNDLLN